MDDQQRGSQFSAVTGSGVTFEPNARAAGNRVSTSKRDPRIDVLRGVALMMIFADHLPGNPLSLITLRNFGFSDAAEVFVLLAGFSSMLAYGRISSATERATDCAESRCASPVFICFRSGSC